MRLTFSRIFFIVVMILTITPVKATGELGSSCLNPIALTEDFQMTDLEFQNVEFTKIFAISRENGKKQPCCFERTGNSVRIQTENTHLTTQTFILQ